VEAKNNFSFLRKVLEAIGLSPEATNDIIERIHDVLSDKDGKLVFLTSAEHKFTANIVNFGML
jgi:hypothetical protein